MKEYPLQKCPECGEEIKTGTLRWNDGWEHKSREVHAQAGHHRVQILKQYPKVLRFYSKRRGKDQEPPMYPVGMMEDKVFIQEKLDGSCFRFGIREEKFVFGSKNYVWEDGEVGKQFRQARDYVKEQVSKESIKQYREDYGKLTVFAENMVLHNLEYNWSNVPEILGFDVYSHKKNRFLHPQKVEEILEDIGIQTVPMLEVRDSEDMEWDSYNLPDSKFRDGHPEGVVVKNPSTGIKAKILNDKFDEHNSLSFGHKKALADSPEERIMAEHCPNIRIIKQLQKQVNEEERELTMEDMMGDAQVHIRVFHDMWEEEYASIVGRNWKIDMKKLRKMVTDRTRKVLKRRINIKERNDLTDQEALSMRWD